MSGERAIDPTEGDYSLVEGEDFEQCDDLANEIYKRLIQPAGQSPLEPEVGRPVRDRLKDVPESRRQLIEDAEQALAPIVTDGRAESVTVEEYVPQTPKPGRLYLLIQVVEAGGRERSYNLWIPVI